jgi:hypothetical protein
MQDTYKVYIKAADNGDIIAPPESTAFFTEDELAARGYVCIDEGAGDHYHHAQGNYLEKPWLTDEGLYRYRLVDGEIVEKSEQEIADEIAALPLPSPSPETVLMSMAIDHEYRLILLEMGV